MSDTLDTTDSPPTETDADLYCNGKTDAPSDAPTIDPGEESPDGYCGRPAGWGTEHKGQGRCKLHGGRAGRPPKHGLYSGRRDELQERFEQAYGDDRIGTLRAEIAALKALLSDFWERIEEVDADTIESATKLQGEIRKSLDTASKIQNREAPTEEEVQRLLSGVSNIIETYVPEPDRPDAINELRSLIRDGRRDRQENGGPVG
jgi:hypothetical protein